MELTITGKTPEMLQENITCVMNIAAVVAGHGYIPTEDDMSEAKRSGKYWYRSDESPMFVIRGDANNWFAHIVLESELSITVLFRYRYDSKGVADALAILIAKRIHDFATINPFFDTRK